ncbi:MAG: bifunctional DNA primase/polymerase, partial [Anaerolineae bacterium]|nr:bifunctional DNA primase/polymerase [Anaerolineae bacterium]
MSNWSHHTQNSLLDKAYQMVMRGWSVIPLRGMGDPAKPKAPALPSWKVYQSYKPRFEELQDWFIEKGYGALGVVLGRVSGIVVIDIDKPEIEIAFQNALPHLANTFTVRSGNRKLPHYYYALSPDLDAPARTGHGIEFRSDGQYVVAPTCVIGESEWRIENPKIPHTLSKRDLSDIYAFLGLYTRKQSETPVKMPLNRELTISSNLPKLSTEERLAPDDLRRWYAENARIYGRNNALFAGGCYARDLGWSYSQVAGVLVSAHITQPPNGDHLPETTSQRMDEARKTLDSVFKRPANIRKRRDKSAVGLSNAVRERLMQLQLDNTARVLDGLLL